RVDASAQIGLVGESEEQREGLVGDAVLGVVEIQAGGLEGQPLAPLRVLGEELPQVQGLHPFVVLTQGLPRGPRGQPVAGRRHHGGHVQLAFPRPALLEAIPPISSRHESTNDLAPSSWSRFASAATSTPADANLARTASLSPPSAVSSPPSEP